MHGNMHPQAFTAQLRGTSPGAARMQALLAALDQPLSDIRGGRNAPANPLLAVASQQDDLPAIRELAGEIASRFAHIVVAGAGGSGLSGKVLCGLKTAGAPCVHFLETIDPDAIEDVLSHLPLEQSFFIVISKSGSTVETIGQFYVLLEAMQRTVGNQKAASHFFAITMAGDNPLRAACNTHGIRVMEHAPDIGGRFSVLTAAGLLPAAIAGLDIAAIRRGAARIVAELQQVERAKDCLPAIGAALQYAFMEQGRNISVMLPYSHRLSGFSSWYRQSWAESLGKSGKGTTPIRAVGTTDQHSQLQLYLDGPKDKLFHVITVERRGTGQSFTVPPREDLAYLRGKTTGDIMAAEQRATIETLVRSGCPVRLFALPKLGEEELGALLAHFTLEIVLMASLLNVNPFDQPAVEEGKELAREYLRTGSL